MTTAIIWVLWSILTLLLLNLFFNMRMQNRRLRLKLDELELRICLQESNVYKLVQFTEYPHPVPTTAKLEEVRK